MLHWFIKTDIYFSFRKCNGWGSEHHVHPKIINWATIEFLGLCELISQSLDKKVYLLQIPFFESSEVDNTIRREKLNLVNPYSVEEGMGLILNY